jgi:ESCRT-II complex subunit VPS25
MNIVNDHRNAHVPDPFSCAQPRSAKYPIRVTDPISQLYIYRMVSFPDYYHYPPFWTLQRNNPKTLDQQFRLWDSFLTKLTRALKKDVIKVIEALDTPLFVNKTINRRLAEVDAREILDFMAKQGHAEWLNDSHITVRIIWRTNAEWFAILEDWIRRTSQRNMVLTVQEIIENSNGEEFYRGDPQVIVNVLKWAEGNGKVTLFHETNPLEVGVKFIG